MINKQWRKINDIENWPEIKKAKWVKNIFAHTVLDSKIKNKQGGFDPICYDKTTKEYFIFC